MAQGDTLSKINLNSVPPKDSLPAMNATGKKDSTRNDTPAPGDSLAKKSGAAQIDGASRPQKRGIDTAGFTNIVLTQNNIRAYGWGEYKVGGKCLCCDNLLDGDCIIIHSTNRTERVRIKQIVDGKKEADASDKSTYFGDVDEREKPEPVSLLMAEITLKKMTDVSKVVVYTMVDNEKKKNFLSNCEFGYYDQFDRLQWAGKAESDWFDDHIAFELEKPVFTKCILLKVKGGKSRITEVAIFCRNEKK